MRILFLGDIVGRPGRQAVKDRLGRLRQALDLDAVIANAENAAGGVGITTDTLREVLDAGVDVVTLGNHAWRHREAYATLDRETRVVRPANMPPGVPGRGLCVHTLADGRKFAVLNLVGRVFMDPADCPFRCARALLAEVPASVVLRFVDMHAEASSEKKALAVFLDSQAAAVVGTHTHVQTADAAILPGGTAFITDLGMCGVQSSVLGMEASSVLKRFITGLPQRFIPAKGQGFLNGLLVDADERTGKALRVALLREGMPDVLDLSAVDSPFLSLQDKAEH